MLHQQISTRADLYLAKMEVYVTTQQRGSTSATAKMDSLALTVKLVSAL